MIDMGTEMKANGRRIGTIQKHFQKNRSAKSRTEIIIYFHKVTPGVPASPASASTSYISATPEIAKPTPLLPQPIQHEDKDEDLYDDLLPLNEC